MKYKCKCGSEFKREENLEAHLFGTTSIYCGRAELTYHDTVLHVLKGMEGIGGVPTKEEFYSELTFRLKETLKIKISNLERDLKASESVGEQLAEHINYLKSSPSPQALEKAKEVLNQAQDKLRATGGMSTVRGILKYVKEGNELCAEALTLLSNETSK